VELSVVFVLVDGGEKKRLKSISEKNKEEEVCAATRSLSEVIHDPHCRQWSEFAGQELGVGVVVVYGKSQSNCPSRTSGAPNILVPVTLYCHKWPDSLLIITFSGD
jgi:hypothetical protein